MADPNNKRAGKGVAKWTLGALILLGLAAGVVWFVAGDQIMRLVTSEGGAPSGGARRTATQVALAKAQRGSLKNTVETTGIVRAREQVTLTSEVTGTVKSINFEEGQQVQKGDLLVALDASQERAELAEAIAQRDEARKQYRRGQELLEQRAIAQAEVDELRVAYQTAQAQIDVVRAQIENHKIEAPFDGRIGLRKVSPGALLTPETAVATLITSDALELQFDVPSQLLPQLHLGMTAMARVDGFENQLFQGEVSDIDNRINPATRTVTLEARLLDADEAMRPGMFASVELVLGTRANTVIIPEEALVFEGDAQYVFAVSRGGIARRRPVVTGERMKGEVEIRNGVKAGERIVVGGVQKINDGQRVKPLAESGEKNGDS